MAKTSRTQWRALSRRTVVIRSLACAAGAAAFAPVQEASAKMAQKAVEYQDTPKGDQECSNCSLFQEPNACTLVDGESGSKRQAKRGRSPADTYTKRRGTPAVTASPCPRAPQIEGAFETINPAMLSTAFQ